MIDEQAANKRDKRLRAMLLDALHRSRIGPAGGLGFQILIDTIGPSLPPTESFEDDNHALGLIRDLVNAGYVTEFDQRTKRAQRAEPKWLFFKVTALGSRLALEEAPIDPLVDDDRIG